MKWVLGGVSLSAMVVPMHGRRVFATRRREASIGGADTVKVRAIPDVEAIYPFMGS